MGGRKDRREKKFFNVLLFCLQKKNGCTIIGIYELAPSARKEFSMAEAYKWVYTATSGRAWITGLEGEAPESLTVPDTLGGCEVTAMGL